MIVARIEGGLGNQMFQYAYASYLAQQNSTQLWLDLTSYENKPHHGYLLDRFRIDARVLDLKFRDRIPTRYREQDWPSWRCWLSDFMRLNRLQRYKERPFGFQPKHLAVKSNRYLVGYWQSEDFFPGMRQQLLSTFQPAQPLSDASQQVLEEMRSSHSAAVHIRRGDYISNQSAASIYHHLDLQYYHRSLNHWAASKDRDQSEIQVFVFSNDIAWCREHFRLPWKVHWVDHNTGANAHEDLILMSRSSCCVIANSTFSWWAAWLNQHPDRAVYAPSHWFRDQTLDDSHLVCRDWWRMPIESQPIVNPNQQAA